MAEQDPVVAARAAAEVFTGELEDDILEVVVVVGRLGLGLGRARLAEQRGGGGELVVDVGAAVEAEVPDLVEARGEDVEEEAPDELLGREGDLSAVLGAEGDGVVVEGDEAVVGDGDPVGVAAEVGEDLASLLEGGL